jgi:hypothetical protein
VKSVGDVLVVDVLEKSLACSNVSQSRPAPRFTPGKQGLALWYVGTRITEGTLFLVGVLGLLSLFALSTPVKLIAARCNLLPEG